MKKYFLMLVMLFTMSVYSFAEDTNATEIERIERYDIKVNIRKLGSFLELSKDQMESVETIENEFNRDLMFAAVECTKDNRMKVTDNAIEKHIRHMSYILSDKQYRKYLKVLNLTINNRGIRKVE
jgi:hypothetical protein